MIIFGARQVGKTYLIEEFAKNNYDYIYSINFEFEKSATDLFSGNLDIKHYYCNCLHISLIRLLLKEKTLLFFDEVQKCPQVLTALKSFAIERRFDVVASSSMLGIIMHEVSSYPVGYVETLYMRPMSFYGPTDLNMSKLILEMKFHWVYITILNKMFLHYIAVGGMLEVVKTFLDTSNIFNVLEIHKRIVNDYKQDIAKYASGVNREKVRKCFESIPNQLAKNNKKFQY